MTFQIYGQHCTFESHAKFEFMNLKRRHRLCTFMYRLVKVIAQSIIMTSKSFYSNCSLPLIIKILINRLVIINRGCLTHAPHVSTFKSIAFPQFSHPNSVWQFSIPFYGFVDHLANKLLAKSFWFPLSPFFSLWLVDHKRGLLRPFSPSLFHSSSYSSP